MKLDKSIIVKPFKFGEVERPWGHYGLYAENENCTAKILYIRPGETLSLQYHLKRAQFYLLLSDGFTIQYSTSPVSLDIANMSDADETKFKYLEEFLSSNLVTVSGKKFDMFGFHEYVVHRAKYEGNEEYGMILDIAFGINIESDICRIKDNYNRESKNI